MTNLIRRKNTFHFHGQAFECFDLSLEDFLLFCIDPEEACEKVLLECNEELPKLNNRQKENFVRIVFGGQEEKKQLLETLTDTQKKIQEHQKKQKADKAKQDVDDMLEDWHIIEWQMMHFTNQPLSEMRKWPYKYFMSIYKDLAYCTGSKEYEKGRNSKSPDKKAFKQEFGDFYK